MRSSVGVKRKKDARKSAGFFGRLFLYYARICALCQDRCACGLGRGQNVQVNCSGHFRPQLLEPQPQQLEPQPQQLEPQQLELQPHALEQQLELQPHALVPQQWAEQLGRETQLLLQQSSAAFLGLQLSE